MNKLFVAFILLAFCAAVSQAGMAVTTYSDSSCTNATGFSRNQETCGDKKRAIDGDLNCNQVGSSGVFFSRSDCVDGPVVIPAPSGWQQFQFDSSLTCGEELILLAVPAPGVNIPIVGIFQTTFYIFNTTLSCSNEGVMSISTCFDLGCLSFDSVPNGVCSNITTTIMDQQYSGIQTTCVAAPSSEPVSAAPVTAPVAGPVKKSSEAVNVVCSVLTIFAIAVATLLC